MAARSSTCTQAKVASATACCSDGVGRDVARADGVPHRRLTRAEDRGRAQQHAGGAGEPLEGGVGVALDDAVRRRAVRHQRAVLVDVPDPGAAVVDAGRRDVHQQGHGGGDRGLGDHERAVEADAALVLGAGAERVDGGDERVRVRDHGVGEGRLGEVADVLLDARSARRGADPAYDGAHGGTSLGQGGHHVAADQAVGTGHDDDGVSCARGHAPHLVTARKGASAAPRGRRPRPTAGRRPGWSARPWGGARPGRAGSRRRPAGRRTTATPSGSRRRRCG